MKPYTVDSVLLAALEQFEYQATSRLLLAALEEYEDSGTTQKEDFKKTPPNANINSMTRLQDDFNYDLNGSRSCCSCKLHVLSVGVLTL